MNKSDLISRYTQMGVAAILPGLVRAVEVLQEEIDSLKQILTDAQPPLPERRGVGRPKMMLAPAAVEVLNAEPERKPHRYWAGLSAEQRKAEMQRRYNVRLEKVKAAAQATPQAPATKLPTSAASKAATSKQSLPVQAKNVGSRNWYASLTPEQKAEHSRKMSVGLKKAAATKKRLATLKAKKQLVNGHAATEATVEARA